MTMSEPVAKKPKHNEETEEMADPIEPILLRYVEFYSGVGGWTMALEEAITRLPGKKCRLCRVAALDHSDLCTKAFEHNFGSQEKSFDIERLTLQQVEEWNVTIWAMSPPCQPHTRQHSNQAKDLKDPRSSSFLHLLDLIKRMKQDCLPSLLFLENVVGFESSSSFDLWVETLETRGYHVGSFHLNPTQVGLPNDRPRYFGLAVLKQSCGEGPTAGHALTSYWNSEPRTILKSLPELGVPTLDDSTSTDSALPCIESFLDQNQDHQGLAVPLKILQGSAAWCFDVVTPASLRSACFTQSYGRYIRGTGSILYQDKTKEIPLLSPEDRSFDKDWAKDLDLAKFRYFSGLELARLMGFSKDFSFPPNYTYKQQWKLIGNSLNVQVASKIVELGIRLILKM